MLAIDGVQVGVRTALLLVFSQPHRTQKTLRCGHNGPRSGHNGAHCNVNSRLSSRKHTCFRPVMQTDNFRQTNLTGKWSPYMQVTLWTLLRHSSMQSLPAAPQSASYRNLPPDISPNKRVPRHVGCAQRIAHVQIDVELFGNILGR